MGIEIMQGICQCIDDWRKPKARILKHLKEFGPEICPHCSEEINWTMASLRD
jgi:hypothetical protein